MSKQTVGMLMGIYNEAKRIEACLDYHLPYLDEVVIVIQKSIDGTEEIVDNYFKSHDIKIPHKVLHFPKKGFSEATLEDGLQKMKSDWVLYVDADEKFPEEFLQKVHDLISKTKMDGFWFERDNFFEVPIFNEGVPIEPKTMIIKHPARDRQFRLTRRSETYFPRQIHVRARVRGPFANGQDEEKTFQLDYTMYHLKSLQEQWNDNVAYLPQTKLVDAMEKTRHGQLIEIPSVLTDGTLYFAEGLKQIPFDIKRVFYIKGSMSRRGGHANRRVNEVLFCIQGKVSVRLEGERGTSNFVLDDPSKGLYIKAKTWVDMFDFSPDAILLCFASEYYSEDDYVRNGEEFEAEIKESF